MAHSFSCCRRSLLACARRLQPLRLFSIFEDRIPFDAAIHTATLANGLKYFVRQNERPAKRVALRLAVKSGSLEEADDQQGLAHFIEHMAFNGSTHFKPGELVSAFESVGARLGPHVNAYTSFDETVYMLDLPSGQPEIVAKGLTALADVAGGLTFDPTALDKERGVVIEEWRGGLGASSRVRDKQLPLLFYQSRYAERLPIGKPDIIRTTPASRLRAFYDTWYRPDRMAVIAVGDIEPSQMTAAIVSTFGPLTPRAPAAPMPNAAVPLPQTLLVSFVADPEVTQSVVEVVRKRPAESEQHVADYRRDLVQQLTDHMFNERFSELARKPDAPFLGAGVSGGRLGRTVHTFTIGAGVQDGKLDQGITAIATEARRVREYGFTAAEIDRAKKWMAALFDRVYAERDKTDSGSFAQECLKYFLVDEPTPGVAYEHQLVQQVLPGITLDESWAAAKRALTDDSRVVLAVSPQKPGLQAPTDAELLDALAQGEKADVAAWTSTATGSLALMEHKPEPGTRRLAPHPGHPRRHHRPIRQRRRSVAEADRLQKRSGSVLDGVARRRFPRAARRFPGSVALGQLRERFGSRSAEIARYGALSDRQARIGVAVHAHLDARIFRERGARRARDGAADSLRPLHGAGRRPGGVRVGQASARRLVGQPRAVAWTRVQRPRGGCQHLAPLHSAAGDAGARRDARPRKDAGGTTAPDSRTPPTFRS